jgi:hypothetical protein
VEVMLKIGSVLPTDPLLKEKEEKGGFMPPLTA